MFEGRAEEIAADQRAPAQPTGAIGWGQTIGSFPGGRRLRAYNLPERWMEIEDPKTGAVKRITFDYQSEGAGITSLVAGPDGRVRIASSLPARGLGPGQYELRLTLTDGVDAESRSESVTIER